MNLSRGTLLQLLREAYNAGLHARGKGPQVKRRRETDIQAIARKVEATTDRPVETEIVTDHRGKAIGHRLLDEEEK